ncbi:hypothetical protein JD844_007962 [Phrynosoma platyrhinos]|uniref:Uncharacterized protein n=1 Tax=Phrynosoma platyrhinos TaxID=52577 RepID=A0ABQ7T461_PHRPL|nr:hypothetical protein JD844_007962 [Phrynosoma platyrhinos]
MLPISSKIFKVVCAVVFGHQSYYQEEEIETFLEESDMGIKFGGTISHIRGNHHVFSQQQSKNDPDSTYNDDNLAQCILDFLMAGTETTSTVLQWALLLMAVHPDIQDKVYKEMENVLGTSQSICYQDRKKMPYTNAVIHEIIRIKYVFPIGIPRRSVKDVVMHGYTIPKVKL